MIAGFKFHETMSGSYHLLASPTEERAIEFTITAKADDVRRFARDKTWHIAGEVDVEGFADKKPLDGTLAFKLVDEHRLPYRFGFSGNDGKSYELRGQKDWKPIAPVASMTVLPASIYDADGNEVGRATLRFDLRNDLFSWLKSFRLFFG